MDALTIYPYHSVNSIDTWYPGCNMMLVLYLVPPGPFGKRVSFYRFIVSLLFYRYRYRYTEIVSVRYFLSYRFQTITPKFGTISTTNVHILHFFDSIPTIFLVHFSGCPCIASAQITPSTCKRESIPVVLCFQALEMLSLIHI